MPLDGFTLHFLTEELRRDIVGCRVEKVHQPSKDELVMHLREALSLRVRKQPARPSDFTLAGESGSAANVLHAHAKASDERTDNRCAPKRA